MNRAGTVLVIVLLSVLALELVAMSAFAFARMAELASIHAHARARLRAAAEDAIAHTVATLRAEDVSTRAAGARWNLIVPPRDGMDVGVEAHRHAAGPVLLGATAAAQHASATALALVWFVDPDSILAGFRAVVSTSEAPALPEGPPVDAACPDGRAPASLPGHALLAPGDTLPFGQAARIRWGQLPHMAAADSTAARDGSAGGARFVFAAADTTLAEEFAGVLAVNGNLRLAAGAHARGLLVVRGLLLLDAGAVLHGAARAQAVETRGAAVAWDRCAVEGAVRTGALARAYRIRTRWRLPAY